jgi:hypothetical protein
MLFCVVLVMVALIQTKDKLKETINPSKRDAVKFMIRRHDSIEAWTQYKTLMHRVEALVDPELRKLLMAQEYFRQRAAGVTRTVAANWAASFFGYKTGRGALSWARKIFDGGLYMVTCDDDEFGRLGM